MKRKVLAAILIGMMAVTTVFGCGNKNTTDTKKETTTTAKETKEEYKTIGTEDKEAYKVQLKNETGQDIIAVSVKSSSEEKYPDSMLKENDSYKKDETRVLYYKPSEEAAKETATESGKALPAEYSVQLTLADKTVVELHAFPFEDVEEGQIKIQDGVAYLTYKKDGAEVSTLDAELATKAQKEQDEKAKAEAEAAAQAEAQAQAEAAAQAEAQAQTEAASQQSSGSSQTQTYTESASSGGSSQTYTEPVQETPAPSQPAADTSSSDDGCVGDGLTY